MSPRPLARRLKAGILGALVAACVGLCGCVSDDEASGSRTAGATRSAGATTDPGSRYMDAAGPLGGLTVETPPGTAPNPERVAAP